jgi:phosphoribosylamine---glycine ligase
LFGDRKIEGGELSKMNVLIIGSGGREHGLAWAIAKSPLLEQLYCSPGNAGMAQVSTCVKLDVENHQAIIDFVFDKNIGFVVIGPEAPLVDGLADSLETAGIKAFGPSAAAARLEGSKAFTKDLCAAHNIPTAAYGRFKEATCAKAYLGTQKMPIVIKADGLAAGKGVIIAENLSEAEAAVDDIFNGQFGEAGSELIIEEFLVGEEASFFVLVDGEHCLAMASAQDHKQVGEGDVGPNTGGMGAYSPAAVMDTDMCAQTMHTIIEPTVQALKQAGTPFRGVLFAGLMITTEGPKLIEYNVRFGDPECQVLMMRLNSDLLPALMATVGGSLSDIILEWRDEVALCVVMATQGYPGAYEKGSIIKGLGQAGALDNVHIFHAGTARKDGEIIATGGRVLNVTATGKTVSEAQARAYEAVDRVNWPEGFCRRDIGWRAIDREKE